MKIDPQHPDIIIETGCEDWQGADGAEAAVKQETGESGYDKGDYCVGGKAAAPNADGGKDGGQHQQADIAACGCAGVDASLSRKALDTKEIDQGRHQGDDYDDEAGQVFTHYQPAAAERRGLEGLKSPHPELVGKAAHGDGGDQQQQDPGGQLKELVEGSVPERQDIGIGKYK